jgi:hypothetical protein
MELVSVESSNVDAIGYDAERKVLIVRFKGTFLGNGAIYEYEEVSADKHSRLMAADSKGGFLNREIKGSHSYRKVG